MVDQTFYTGNLPATGTLCSTGTLTGLVQTPTGWTWMCEGMDGGIADTGCSLLISYCGDGILGTGNGYLSGTEMCDDGNIANGDGCDMTCNIESPILCTINGYMYIDANGNDLYDTGEVNLSNVQIY
jgi:cysteine-rich repeat protein